jgi:iron(III)-enterobactin esterase
MNRIVRPFSVCFAGLLVAGFGAGVAQEKHDTTGNGDFFVGPDYEIDPDLKDKGYPKGQSFEFSMPSNSSCRCRAPKSED